MVPCGLQSGGKKTVHPQPYILISYQFNQPRIQTFSRRGMPGGRMDELYIRVYFEHQFPLPLGPCSLRSSGCAARSQRQPVQCATSLFTSIPEEPATTAGVTSVYGMVTNRRLAWFLNQAVL